MHPQFSLPPLTTTITLTAALVSCLLDAMWQHAVSKSAADLQTLSLQLTSSKLYWKVLSSALKSGQDNVNVEKVMRINRIFLITSKWGFKEMNEKLKITVWPNNKLGFIWLILGLYNKDTQVLICIPCYHILRSCVDKSGEQTKKSSSPSKGNGENQDKISLAQTNSLPDTEAKPTMSPQ